MTRILITNAYSARNRGDAAIILGMIESLRQTSAFREAEIRISSADDRQDARWYPEPTAPSFASLKSDFSRSPTAGQLYFLLVLLPASLAWAAAWRLAKVGLPVPRGLRGLLQTYAAADVVVAAGGGYLYTTSALRGGVVLLTNLYSFFFAVLLGKPVALYAQSIGPFAATWQARIVRFVLARVRLVEVREKYSQRLIDDWKLTAPVGRAGDAAFLLEAVPPAWDSELVRSADGPTVGMTVRGWFRSTQQQMEYEGTIASFVQWLTRERRASVVFLPQVTFAEGGDDDRVVARRIAEAVQRDDRVRVVENELSAPEMKWLCCQMDVFVGTRMHSNIFALSCGVPTLAIAYQPKTAGIMAELGLGDWVTTIDSLDPAKLQASFDALVARTDEIRGHLAEAVPRVMEQALDGGRLIAEVVSRGVSR
jgi:colanic acid/amylovoran biosynthesis protein